MEKYQKNIKKIKKMYEKYLWKYIESNESNGIFKKRELNKKRNENQECEQIAAASMRVGTSIFYIAFDQDNISNEFFLKMWLKTTYI